MEANSLYKLWLWFKSTVSEANRKGWCCIKELDAGSRLCIASLWEHVTKAVEVYIQRQFQFLDPESWKKQKCLLPSHKPWWSYEKTNKDKTSSGASEVDEKNKPNKNASMKYLSLLEEKQIQGWWEDRFYFWFFSMIWKVSSGELWKKGSRDMN